jgi:hypothetical protein
MPCKFQTPYRDILMVGVLIGAVCFLTLTPAMYLVFHALQWKRALYILEVVFLPVLLLAVAAGLLAYQRTRARRAPWSDDHSHQE